ncbi:unnamed protein product [Albugo candida]|uniref:Uncharacterized protein n=1 Tax=Albugo candida TaxID=65357 RepID=A0A024GM97_9STRA|nr:unnamed protein product [Albugo candida]|eukprot:CCI47991.1 unnamed protein product [Albugo candida]
MTRRKCDRNCGVLLITEIDCLFHEAMSCVNILPLLVDLIFATTLSIASENRNSNTMRRSEFPSKIRSQYRWKVALIAATGGKATSMGDAFYINVLINKKIFSNLL